MSNLFFKKGFDGEHLAKKQQKTLSGNFLENILSSTSRSR